MDGALDSGTVLLNLGTANKKQELFYRSRKLYTAYGGAKGGGKTHAIRTKAVGGALRWPGIRILIVRRTYPELQQNHIEPILRMVPKKAAAYNSTHHTMYFVNGSIIKFGHFQNSAAEQKYQGQEYDWIFMDEATQFSEREFRFLGGCLRGTGGAPKRFYITCNPGGIGHSWVKRLFIDRKFNEGEDAGDYEFIFASVEDNEELLKSSPTYLKMLDMLPENMRRAYRHGDWDVLSGAYFSEFSTETHVVKPFSIPPEWMLVRTFDYGLDMLACYWIAVAPDGRGFVYREVKKAGLLVSEAARLILANTPPTENIAVTFAPPDIWSKQKDTGKTMAEIFMAGGVPIVKAANNRTQGHIQVKEMLRSPENGKPGLVFFEGCRGVIGDIQAILADDENPNDCAKEPHDITHSVDAIRYFCASRLPLAESGISAERGGGYETFMTGGALPAGYFDF